MSEGEKVWSADIIKAVNETREKILKSGIPGMPDSAEDSVTTSFEAFRREGTYIGTDQAFGGIISDKWRLFYSTREPVGKWWVVDVARDLWDNWFKIRDVADLDSEALDLLVQPVLEKLMARQQLTRETVFERRYGTSILLLSYTGFNTDWETPLFKLDKNGMPPESLESDVKLLMITPYPWTQVEVATLNEDKSSLRYGFPETYTITVGSTITTSTSPTGRTAQGQITVHWTRVIHDAPRLDEHPYEGISALDPIFDDLVGFRNGRWGIHQTLFRHGSGFPVITTTATRKENEAWIAMGGVVDMMARSYGVVGPNEKIEFVGAQDSALNPKPYSDIYYGIIAAGTGIAQDNIKGVSAGRVTGSEVNERQKFAVVSLLQNEKEKMLRELIDRLIQTGQVDFDGEYVIDWLSPFEVNPQDKVAMQFMEARTQDYKLAYMTINEIREAQIPSLPPIEGGDVIVGRAGAQSPFNQSNPTLGETKPEEGTPPESELFDEAKRMAMLNG